jgi:CRP-like cAMP-binding protein
VDLNEEPRFFSSYTHFVSQTVTNENLHCITDCEILQISIEDFRLSQISSLSSKEFTIKLFEQIMESDKQRMIDKNILTAEQRYIKFIKTNPKIYQNVPLKYMASYLGITQRHLSRLRGL